MSAPKILISACLLGRPVRYNGSAKTVCIPLWLSGSRLASL
nr:DUF523 domain-containing protein [Acetobacter persici]